MAARLVEVPVSVGEVVIRTGEPGDRFYMVADGALEVTNGVPPELAAATSSGSSRCFVTSLAPRP
jgi:hypothetical protein